MRSLNYIALETFITGLFLLCLSSMFFSQSAKGESLGKLESFQKQAADTVKAAGELSEDMLALDFLAGKLRQFMWLDLYPNKEGQMLSETFRPRFRFQSNYLLAPGEVSLAPTREIRKQKSSLTSSTCDQELTPPLPLFNLPTGNSDYCLDNAESTQNLEVDGSGLASLQKSTELSNSSDIQVGYISVPAKFPEDYFSNLSSQVARNLDSFKPKRVQFLRFIPFKNEPQRVQFIEAKVGGLTAQIPYPEPAFLPPQCEVRLDTPPSPQCQSLFPGVPCIDSDSAQFSLVNTSGVVIGASFNDEDLEDKEIPQQTVQAVKNEVLKTITISGLRELIDEMDIQSEPAPNGEFKQGLVTISGEVSGPNRELDPSPCQITVAVRNHEPCPDPDGCSPPSPPPVTPCRFTQENYWERLGIQTNMDYCSENNRAGTGWVNCRNRYDFGNLEFGISEKRYSPNNNSILYRVGRWPHTWNSRLRNPDERISGRFNCRASQNRLCIRQADINHVRNFVWFISIKDTDRESCRVADVIARDAGGCFTADTPIAMANGKEKLVSEIRENEYVFNPHYRTGIRVKKVVKGPEPKPLFEVALNGKKIKVTEDHPFFSERGWVQTLALKKGDKLFGEGKGKVVESVRKLPYQKPVDVWNFELDTEDPLAHIVMANGVPTGDLVTQLELKKQVKKLP